MENRRADRIARELEDLIFAGEFTDGMRLDEVRLAERFGVSRTPIREAFQKLSLSGMVEQLPRRGVFVRHPGPVELMEMFEVMAELEAACGRMAARRITDPALEQLHEANRKCRDALEAGEAETYYSENEVFHFLIYSQSGNRFLEEETRKLHRRLKPYRRKQLLLRGRMKQSMAEHEAVLKALEDGDGDKVAETLRPHVAVQGERFKDLMSSMTNDVQKIG
ncbi:FCD domain-containing protein [Sneathiella sp. P13V-1]|uniref:GntR family transcriptional regulator n=1 Tax=Sneathiella sp. P13V-1 TaxID=2697366 RepID=UPI00187B19E1|nr:GntR family transcriptional regulator [Sneathiella sp. P13V-1]MBE7636135.1 FCD domain-containing protein [Sneathiella sp. P13V-1]